MRQIDGLYRRPFLTVARSLVRASVVDLETFEDPHNADRRFARARVRTIVLPAVEEHLGPGVADALARSADMLRDDADALDALALDGITDHIDTLVELPRAVRTRIVRRLALDAGCPANDLTRDHVLCVDALITRWRGQGPLDLPGAVKCERRGGRLTFYREDARSQHESG
jgi:tRNA(Ile)-lysidine synthase